MHTGSVHGLFYNSGTHNVQTLVMHPVSAGRMAMPACLSACLLPCCCRCYADSRKKSAGEMEEWRMTNISPAISARTPPWVADCFSSSHARQSGSHDSSSSADSREQQSDASEAHAVLCDTPLEPVGQLVQGLSSFATQLYPTDEESERLRAVTAAVRHMLECISRPETWQVAQVLPVGSFVRKTSLTNA
jgi:hypothetical protein